MQKSDLVVSIADRNPPPPIITSITPNSTYISGNTYVVITGSNLAAVVSIKFGSVNSQWIFTKNDNEIHCMPFPVASARTVDVVLTTARGIVVTVTNGFIFQSTSITGTLTNLPVQSGQDSWGFQGCCLGNDQNIWWGTAYGAVWNLTSGNVQNRFPITGNGSGGQEDICAGPGGNLWTADNVNFVTWRIPPNGSGPLLADFALPGPGSPFKIITGTDARLWITGFFSGLVWAVDDPGHVTTFSFSGKRPTGIANSPLGDGTIWFTDVVGGTINQLFPLSGSIAASYVISGATNFWALTNGCDGKFYATEAGGLSGVSVFKIDPTNLSGAQRFLVPAIQPQPIGPGPDGNIYMGGIIHASGITSGTSQGLGVVVQITQSGNVSTFTINNPAVYSGAAFGTPFGVATGADGAIYVPVYQYASGLPQNPHGYSGFITKLT